MRCSQVVTAESPRKVSARAERGDQRVLERVGGVLGVAGRAEGDGPEAVAVTREELGEGVGVPGDVCLHEGGVLAQPVVVRRHDLTEMPVISPRNPPGTAGSLVSQTSR